MVAETLAVGSRRCPLCNAEKQRLSRHWRHCDYPEFDPEMQDMLTGMLLGGGSIQGNGDAKHLVLSSNQRQFARYILNRLRWLGHSLKRESGKKDKPLYRVRSHAHKELSEYRKRWYKDDGTKSPHSNLSISLEGLRVWYGIAGGLEWPTEKDSHSRIVFSAVGDDRRAAFSSILQEWEITHNVYDRKIALTAPSTREFLGLIWPPLPGVEYKWMLSEEIYRKAREENKIINVQETTSASVSKSLIRYLVDHYNEIPSREMAKTVYPEIGVDNMAEILGGGAWTDAVSVAGGNRRVASGRQPRGPQAPQSDRIQRLNKRVAKSERDEALQKAAREIGEPLLREDYKKWREQQTEWVPSPGVIQKRWGWASSCQENNIKHGKGDKRYENSPEMPYQTLNRMKESLGHWPSVTEYREHREHQTDPVVSWFYKTDDWPDSWRDIVEQAKNPPETN